jgi:uncharacterized membrane protein (DUF2068 family)
MRGHQAPAARAARLRPEDHDLGADLPDGWRLARCLRCDMWVRTTPPEPGTERWETLPPVDEIPKPRRGKVLHDAIILRAVAIDRAVHSVLFGIIALAVFVLMVKLTAVHEFAHTLVKNLNHSVGEATQGPGGSWLDRELPKLERLEPGALRLVLVISLSYSVVEGIEAVGLWKEKRWAEYLTVLATVGFLPLELRELSERITFLRISALVVNILILVWLLWSKHLFGIRGGFKTLEGKTDWDAIIPTNDTAPVNKPSARKPRRLPGWRPTAATATMEAIPDARDRQPT